MEANIEDNPEASIENHTEVNIENVNAQNNEEAVNINNPKKKKKRSQVWKHFVSEYVGKDEYARCMYCPDVKYKVSCKSTSSTGNLNKHMTEKHPEKWYSNMKPTEESFKFSQDKFRLALLKWVVACDQPFTEVERPEFVEMIATLNPEASVISSATIKRDLAALFEEKRNLVKSRVKDVVGKISFTMDGWTSKNVLSFISIRAHFLNAAWSYESSLLDFIHVDVSHSGYNLSRIFYCCLEHFDIPLSKVMGITMDNITSNDTFMEELRIIGISVTTTFSSANNRVRCLTHVLNLSVQDILTSLKISLNFEEAEEELEDLNDKEEEDGSVEGVLDIEENSDIQDEEEVDVSNKPTILKLRHLVKKVRKSPQKRQELKQICSLHSMKYLVPKIDVKTRWNSTFEMLERAATLKNPLNALCLKDKSLQCFYMNKTEWSELNTLCSLLQKFDRATKYMSMERHPTISAYLPTFYWLSESLRSFISDNPGPLANAATVGLEKLRKYENELQIQNSKIPYFAVFLNPALKLHFFREHKFRNTKEIQKEFTDLYEREYDSGVESINENGIEDELFAFMYKRAKVTSASKEIQKYLQFPLSSHTADILEFWRTHESDFPNLTRMARDILPVQGTSVPVERDFSDAADVVTGNRSSLKPETIRQLMCLKDWYQISF